MAGRSAGGGRGIADTIALTERRAAVRRVPRADAAELAARFGHVVDVRPGGGRGVYRLTARGHAGWFHTRSVRWVVRPKLAWADLSRLVAGPDAHRPTSALSADADDPGPPGPFLDLVAARLAALMRERAAAGLIHGYREAASDTHQVRGRIDFAEQARRPPTAGPFPVVADEFTPDVVWNRIPAAAARRLLDRPDLSPAVRGDLAEATAYFAGVTDHAPAPGDWDRLTYDARSESYRRLVDWCRLILPAVGSGDSGGFLLNLEHLFQCHVGTVLDSPRVRPQAAVALRPTRGPFPALDLRPDFVMADAAGAPRAVWDAKWKSLRAAGPDPADVQQVLAYAAALGVRAAGLVYPGRSFAVGRYTTPSGIGLTVVRLRLAGPADRITRSANRFRRLALGRDGRSLF